MTRLARLCAMVPCLVATWASAQPAVFLDIGSGGQPSITGSMGGSVVFANPTTLADLSVTVDFGELSPVNTSNVVLVRVPIFIRSKDEYQVRATVTANTFAGAPEAMQLGDIGFGIQNLRAMPNGQNCSNHTVLPPFANNPATTVNRTSRAVFMSSLSSLTTGPVILRGPKLSRGGHDVDRRPENGWIFDALFAVVPQFFLPGTSSVTIRFTIEPGPVKIGCN